MVERLEVPRFVGMGLTLLLGNALKIKSFVTHRKVLFFSGFDLAYFVGKVLRARYA